MYWVFLGVHALSLAINAGIAVWVWRRDFGESGRYFLAALVVGFAYGVVGTAVLAQRGTDLAWALFPVVAVFAWASTVTWFAFVLQYTGRGHLLTRRTLGALAGSVVVVGALFLTNPLHETLYAGYEVVPRPYPHSEPVEGQLWFLLTPVGYLVSLASIVLLVLTTLRARNVGRRQGAILSAVFVLTVAFSVVLRAEIRVIPPSVSGVVFNATLAYMLSRERMLTIEPLTRSAVMESMNDALVALTDDERIVDYNGAAADLFPALPEGIGEPVGEVAPVLAGVVEDPPEEVTVSTPDGDRTLAVDVEEVGRRGTRGYAVVLRDVTALERYARDLERQTERLDEFASVVSHDLRNPMMVARGNVRELHRRTDAEEAETAIDALDRIDELVDDALTLARQGQVVEDPRPVDLESTAADAWRFVDAPAATLQVDVDGTVVVADDERLRTLFENLFRNSVEHGTTGRQAEPGDSVEHGSTGSQAGPDDSVEHGSTGSRAKPDDSVEHGSDGVTVRVTTTDDGFRVTDGGRGFPDDLGEEVLEKGVTSDHDGTGLGLAIVESIATAHGWTVEVGDAPEGGARVEFGDVRFAGDTDAAPTAPESGPPGARE